MSTVRSRKGAKALSARFPDLTVVSTADPDWVDQVRQGTGDRPFQVIMDPVGGTKVIDLVGLLGDGGTLLFYGGLDPHPITLPSIRIAHHEITFKGVSSARWLQTTSLEQRRQDVAEAIQIGREAPEKFEVEHDYDLARFSNAIEHSERAGRDGAVLISSDS